MSIPGSGGHFPPLLGACQQWFLGTTSPYSLCISLAVGELTCLVPKDFLKVSLLPSPHRILWVRMLWDLSPQRMPLVPLGHLDSSPGWVYAVGVYWTPLRARP